MGFWKNFNPTGAVGDFITVFRSAGPNRWRFMVPAALMTFGVFYVIAQEGSQGPPRRSKVIYINSWRADRSDAVIRAGNIANQKRKDALAADEAKRAEDVRQMYKTIGRWSGMDVDAIEKRAMADRAAEEAARGAAQMTQQVPVAKP